MDQDDETFMLQRIDRELYEAACQMMQGIQHARGQAMDRLIMAAFRETVEQFEEVQSLEAQWERS